MASARCCAGPSAPSLRAIPGLPFGLASTKTFAIFASSSTNEIVQLGDESSTACLLASPKCHDRAAAEDHLRRDAGSPSRRRKGFRLTSALRFLCLLSLGFRLLGRFLWGFLG